MADARRRDYNGSYTGENLNHVAFPLGGIGAGMVCLSGTGALTHVSIRGIPELFNEPYMVSALCIKGETNQAKILQGPVPGWKLFFPWGPMHMGSGSGGAGKTFGLPHYQTAEFEARFPFGYVRLSDPGCDVKTEICGWSPFIPGDEDASSLPVAALEYTFRNTGDKPIEAIYSFHASNLISRDDLARIGKDPAAFMSALRVDRADNGFALQVRGSEKEPWGERTFWATVDDPAAKFNYRWFRGDYPFDPFMMVWNSIRRGEMPENEPVTDGRPSDGGSLYVPLTLAPGEEKTVCLRLAWYIPFTNLRSVGLFHQTDCENTDSCCAVSAEKFHRAWYTGAFDDIDAVAAYWKNNYTDLKNRSATFSECFQDTTLAPEVTEAIGANLGILKSPTVLRQKDGRFWAYEGCLDEIGCCPGSCTHVWNYAQAVPHLFPSLERSLRRTEFFDSQDDRGHQQYRANLPIGRTPNDFHAACDGQLGGVMKVYRDWRISGDTGWLRELWPQVRQSLEYCIATWDPRRIGVLEEPHHNTYDIEFWGPDSMCSSFYLGALKAACIMGEFLNDDTSAYAELYEKGRTYIESELWNGEYFGQKLKWKDLRAEFPPTERTMWSLGDHSPENLEIMEREGPKYQFGDGCLSDGVLGAWMAAVCGLGEILDPDKVEQHLLAVYRHNFRTDLSDHANPSRSTYGQGTEGGLLLCTWPTSEIPTFPFFYGFEVWTGIEYQVASHLAMFGHIDKATDIVRTCRARYDGRVRNPFDEIECGHWYARALASYALLQGLTGARYDALEKKLYLNPTVEGDFRSFLCTGTGYGTVGVRGGEPFVDVVHGTIDIEEIVYDAGTDR